MAANLPRFVVLTWFLLDERREVMRATGRGLAAWQDDTPPPLLPLATAVPLLLSPGRDLLAARMRGAGAGPELRMELAGHEPRVRSQLDDFGQRAIRRSSGQNETVFFHLVFVAHVELVAVTVAFVDFGHPIQLLRHRILPLRPNLVKDVK